MVEREADRSFVWVEFHSPHTSPVGAALCSISLAVSLCGIPVSDSISALLPVGLH